MTKTTKPMPDKKPTIEYCPKCLNFGRGVWENGRWRKCELCNSKNPSIEFSYMINKLKQCQIKS